MAQNGLGGSASELNADITAWLNALRAAKVDFREDAVRLAAPWSAATVVVMTLALSEHL